MGWRSESGVEGDVGYGAVCFAKQAADALQPLLAQNFCDAALQHLAEPVLDRSA